VKIYNLLDYLILGKHKNKDIIVQVKDLKEITTMQMQPHEKYKVLQTTKKGVSSQED
jgi:hypothetical protein